MLTAATRLLLGALAVSAAAAGCMAPRDAGEADAAPAPPGHLPGRIELTGCVGFSGGTNLYPAPLAPGQAPPGWEPTATDPWGFVLLSGYECSRIGVGPLERGPVRIVWDAHGAARIPDACLAGATAGTIAAVLNALLVDDAEVSGHLRAAYGLPAHHAAIAADSRPQGTLVEHTWSWTPAGGQESRVTFVDDGQRGDLASADRLFWARGDGIGSLDLHYDRTGPTAVPWPGHGPMQPPMLMASTPQASFAGPTSFFAALDGHGAFTLFGDAACREREPPR